MSAHGADVNYLRETIDNYFSDTREERVNSAYKARARDFIYNQFRNFGLQTEFHNFTNGTSAGAHFSNVVGVLKGENFGTAKDKIIGLAAHYDTVRNTKGVDDNGSGMAALLQVAKTIGKQNKDGATRKHTILFAAFDMEEYGYLGSAVFIQQWVNPWLSRNYGQAADQLVPHGVIVMDTIMEFNTSTNSQLIPVSLAEFQLAFPQAAQNIQSDGGRGDFIATIYRAREDRQLATAFKNQWMKQQGMEYEIEMFALPDAWQTEAFENFLRSDHRNFWSQNIASIFLTDTGDFRGDMIRCYHNPCDKKEVMLTDKNLEFLGKTVDSLVSTIDTLAERTHPDMSTHGADANYLRETIDNYFSDTREESVNSAYKARARDFIYNQFRNFGLQTEFHNFTSVTSAGAHFSNVVGVLKGENFGTAKDKIIGLAAHYDTVRNTKGVDDNGSGMAALLQVAKTIGKQNKDGATRKHTILFAAFDMEEYGYLGSEMFIQQWVNPWLSRNYGQAADQLVPHGVIVMDTIMEFNTSTNSQLIPVSLAEFESAFPQAAQNIQSDGGRGDFIATIYRAREDSQLATAFKNQWMKQQGMEYEIEMFALPETWDSEAFENFLRSDHRNFWSQNIASIFLTDTGDFRGDMIQCYHHPCDKKEVMLTDKNLEFLGKTVDSLVSTIDTLAESTHPVPGSANGLLTGRYVEKYLLLSSVVVFLKVLVDI